MVQHALASRAGTVKQKPEVPLCTVGTELAYCRRVRGRITERQLPLAEKSFPGIVEMYQQLQDKSLTFLQLVWIYEEAREKEIAAARKKIQVCTQP